MRRRCLGGCGTLIQTGTYCPNCQPYQGTAWRKLSAYIIARDNGICQRCHQPGANTAGHITPRAFGGSDHPANLQAEHRSCNSAARGGTK